MITEVTNREILSTIFWEWITKCETTKEFALNHDLSIDEADTLIDCAISAQKTINFVRNDDRYAVVYEYMGPSLHNYKGLRNGELIAYSMTENGAWASCAEYHVNDIAKSF